MSEKERIKRRVAQIRQDQRLRRRPVFGSHGKIQCPVCGSELDSFIEFMSANLKLRLGKKDHTPTVSQEMPGFKRPGPVV